MLVAIVLKYIVEVDDESDKEVLVRCLGVKGFTEATDTLIREFHSSTNTSYKWAIGNTLSIIGDPNSLSQLEEIAQDVRHGITRQMVVIAIGKLKNNSSIPLLVRLLNDEEVAGHAIMALSNFNDPSLLPYVRPFTDNRAKWISREAQKMIKKLDVGT